MINFWCIVGVLFFFVAGIGQSRIYIKTKLKFALFFSITIFMVSLLCITYFITHLGWLAAALGIIGLITMTIAEVLASTVEKEKYMWIRDKNSRISYFLGNIKEVPEVIEIKKYKFQPKKTIIYSILFIVFAIICGIIGGGFVLPAIFIVPVVIILLVSILKKKKNEGPRARLFSK